jgi:biotin carboxyl carrier protein
LRYRYQSGGKLHEVILERHGAGYRARVEGETYDLEVLDAQPGEINLAIEGRSLTVYWATEEGKRWLSSEGCTYLLEKPTTRGLHTGVQISEREIRSPMPAQVRAVLITEGAPIEKGETLLLLEAMKMEIRIQSPQTGRVSRLPVMEGQTVERDQLLVEIE